MLIIPAVDIRGGKCVRLTQGDYARESVYFDDPVEPARRWEREGAQYLHVVDLDGARRGSVENLAAIQRIIRGVAIPVQVGGGVRDAETAKRILDVGADRVVVGTRAAESPEWAAEMCVKFAGRVAIGLDVRDGEVRMSGWEVGSGKNYRDAARVLDGVSAAAIIFTDVSKDGMLQGPNLAAIGELASTLATPVIASGGISSLDDVRALGRLDVAGAIIGKSLYTGALKLPDALGAARAARP